MITSDGWTAAADWEVKTVTGRFPSSSHLTFSVSEPVPEPDPITQLGDLVRGLPHRRKITTCERASRTKRRKQAQASRRRNRR